MIPVLQYLYSKLTTDVDLASRLATYHGGPAVFLGKAPSDAQMPYVTLHADSAVPEEGHATERMLLAVDVYDRSESALGALQIAGRIETALDRQKPGLTGITGLAIFRDFQALVDDEDPTVQHVHLEFVVRYGRNDLFA
ncbi:MAG: tail completion protein gp17 [Bacillota bacterium]